MSVCVCVGKLEETFLLEISPRNDDKMMTMETPLSRGDVDGTQFQVMSLSISMHWIKRSRICATAALLDYLISRVI